MKIKLNDKPAGLVLLVALLVIVVAGIVMASYLKMMQSEAKSAARSQVWNKCVPVMEAGVEEAMAQIQACGNSTNLSSNGWTYYTNGYYQKTRSLSTNGSYYVVSIQAVQPPVIYSAAYVPIPGTSTNYISRKVKVATQSQQAAPGGLTAKGKISFSGGSQFDSFDSSSGPYNPANPGTNALALTDTNCSGAISMSGGEIYGMAVTGPGGTVNFSGGAKATGGTNNDANLQINDIQAPNTANWVGSLGGVGAIGITNYTYLLNNANYYYNGSLTLGSGKTIGVQGNVTLYVTGDFALNSTFIYVAPGATLTLYLGGNFTVSGSGIVNGTGNTASTLTVYGLPGCNTITYSGGAAFVGTVDAPEANFTFSGSAGAYGAFTANSITLSGGASVHYDQALGRTQNFVVGSWNEL